MSFEQDNNSTSGGEDLLSSIDKWRAAIVFFGVVVVIAYLVKFGASPAEAQDKWGQFGDYIGGLLNPVMAFAAFYWLTQSVRLQRQELAETRVELEKQAHASADAVRLQALTAIYEVYAADQNLVQQRILGLEVELRAAKRVDLQHANEIEAQISGHREMSGAPQQMQSQILEQIRAILDGYSKGTNAPR